MKKASMLAIIFVAVAFIAAPATIIDIPDDYATIQEGIDASSDGDTVLVQPGTYVENINFNGHNIVLGSLFLITGDRTYIVETIIDGGSSGSVVTLESGEDTTTVIAGFTIRNGMDAFGAGIYCYNNSDPLIADNIISENTSGHSSSEFGGGGISCLNSSPAVRNNIVCHNKANYMSVGGGILIKAYSGENSSPIITNNAIYGNVSSNRGNGVCCDGYSSPTITNNIIWGNGGVEIYVSQYSSPSITYCDIQGGYEGEGNIDLNPLFCGDLVSDFNVCGQSPCVNAGDPGISDPDGTRSDIGVFYADHPICSFGNLWYVSTSGNDTTGDGSSQNPFRTIQYAVGVSLYGDTVVVDNGTFVENIDLHGKAISLTSNYVFTGDTLDIENTIIDGGSTSEPVLTLLGCDSVAAIAGFTIIHDPSHLTHNIDCLGADVEIRNNVITGSDYDAIHCEDCNSIVNGNVVYGNGGGIYCWNCNLYAADNIIRDNSMIGDGGGIHCAYSSAWITNNTISGNQVLDIMGYSGYGGGIYYSNSEAVIINNTITGNHASQSGGGIFGWGDGIIMNTILWADSADYGNEIAGGNTIITYSNIDGGWEGEGNIDVDPLFRNPENDDFRLMAIECGNPENSPCIDAGHPFHQDSLLDCSFGLGTDLCDMGACGGGIRPTSGIIHVPDHYPAIRIAIMVSSDGDTVLVHPGTYVENIDFRGRNIVVGSLFLTSGDTSYISTTIIDGDSSGSVVTFENGEDSTAVIAGFTIKNGFAENGGGISCEDSDPLIRNNLICENYAAFSGGIFCQYSNAIIRNNVVRECSGVYVGGIFCQHSNPIISNNAILDNIAEKSGGIFCRYSDPIIVGNTIRGNRAQLSSGSGGGIRCDNSDPTISDNNISTNLALFDGGGIYCSASNATLSNNVIFGNSSDHYGGAVYCRINSDLEIYSDVIYANTAGLSGGGLYCYSSDPVIKNVIFWDNDAQNDPEIRLYGTSTAEITYSDIEGGWEGSGNIDTNPLFRDPQNGDFHLMFTPCGDTLDSPCIDAGDPAILDSLLDCNWGMGWYRSDMGAYGGGDSAQVDNEGQDALVSRQFALPQNYPNPFNASTIIRYILPSASDVSITIYDLLGRRVETLVQGEQPAGSHQVVWDASDRSSGLYFYRIQAGEYVETRKMALLK